MSLLRMALGAALLSFAMGSAQASTVALLPVGETSVEVTADLAALGLSGAPTGTASVDVSGVNPVFSFAITGGTLDMGGNFLIEHEGSGVALSALADPMISATVGNFLIDTGAGTVAGNVNGGSAAPVLFEFGTVSDAGIPLLISGDLAGALSAVFGAPDLTGAQFGLANTAPAAVPLPAALPLLLAGIAGLALLRRRRAA